MLILCQNCHSLRRRYHHWSNPTTLNINLPTTLDFNIYCTVKTSAAFYFIMIELDFKSRLLSVWFPSAIRLRENICAFGLFDEGVFACCCCKAMGFMCFNLILSPPHPSLSQNSLFGINISLTLLARHVGVIYLCALLELVEFLGRECPSSSPFHHYCCHVHMQIDVEHLKTV